MEPVFPSYVLETPCTKKRIRSVVASMDLRISELERLVQTDAPIDQLKLALNRLKKRVRTSCPPELPDTDKITYIPLNYFQFNKMTAWLSQYTDRWLSSISFEKEQLMTVDEGSSSILFLRKMLPHTTFEFWSELHQTQQYFHTHFTSPLPNILIPKKEKQVKGVLLYALYETQPERFYETPRHIITLLRMYILFLSSNKSSPVDFWIPLNEDEGEMLSEFISRVMFTCRFSAIIGGYDQIARELNALIMSMVQFIEHLDIPIVVKPPPIHCTAKKHDHRCDCRYDAVLNFVFQVNVKAADYPLKSKSIHDFYVEQAQTLHHLRSELVGNFHHREFISLNNYVLENYQSGRCSDEEMGLVYLQLTQYSLMIMYYWPTLFNFPTPTRHLTAAELLIMQTQAQHIYKFSVEWYKNRPQTKFIENLFPPIPPHVLYCAIIVFLNLSFVSDPFQTHSQHSLLYLAKARELEAILDATISDYHCGSEFKSMLQYAKPNFIGDADYDQLLESHKNKAISIGLPFDSMIL